MSLPILQYGHPLLRKKAQPVLAVTEEVRSLVMQMVATMDKSLGIGLAAPQVGHLLRLIVLRNCQEGEDGMLTLTHPQVYINPKITVHPGISGNDVEGCLSIPGIREEVERALSLSIEALDLEGNPFKEGVFGYKARIILHENDHLNGVLFIDRLPKAVKKKIAPALKEIQKRQTDLQLIPTA